MPQPPQSTGRDAKRGKSTAKYPRADGSKDGSPIKVPRIDRCNGLPVGALRCLIDKPGAVERGRHRPARRGKCVNRYLGNAFNGDLSHRSQASTAISSSKKSAFLTCIDPALYKPLSSDYQKTMHLTFWIVTGFATVLLVVSAASLFSSKSRNQRNRRRNYGRVATRLRRPMVTLSCKTGRA